MRLRIVQTFYYHLQPANSANAHGSCKIHLAYTTYITRKTKHPATKVSKGYELHILPTENSKNWYHRHYVRYSTVVQLILKISVTTCIHNFNCL